MGRSIRSWTPPPAQVLPEPHLLSPIGLGRDGAKVALGDGVAAGARPGKEEDLLLDVGRQLAEVHDLAEAGAGDVDQAGQFGLPASPMHHGFTCANSEVAA